MDFDVGVVAVGLARKQRLHLVAIGLLGEAFQRSQPLSHDLVVALGLAHFDEFDGIGHLALDLAHGRDRGFEALLLLRDCLRLLGIVPQRRILHARVEFVEAAQSALPVERLADERKRGFDPLDMGLPFGTHGEFL